MYLEITNRCQRNALTFNFKPNCHPSLNSLVKELRKENLKSYIIYKALFDNCLATTAFLSALIEPMMLFANK